MPTVIGSTWVQKDVIFKLKSCPSGYYVSPKLTDIFDAAQKKCVQCGKGEGCTNTSCVACFPCQTEYYKATVSSDQCMKYPANT